MNRSGIFILGIFYGFCLGLIISGLEFSHRNVPVELSEREQKGVNTQLTFPMDIQLKILSEVDFARIKTRPDVIALTKVSGCTIFIPENWEIIYRASSGTAIWKDPDNGETLAHEILHCLRGSWHPGWEKIKGE